MMDWGRFAVDDEYCAQVGKRLGLSVVFVPLRNGGD